MCTVHSASMTSLGELLALISIAFGLLPKHNSENTILIPHCVAFGCNFQSKGNKRSNARLS